MLYVHRVRPAQSNSACSSMAMGDHAGVQYDTPLLENMPLAADNLTSDATDFITRVS
jgi:hypothetical protein